MSDNISVFAETARTHQKMRFKQTEIFLLTISIISTMLLINLLRNFYWTAARGVLAFYIKTKGIPT